MEFYPTWVFFLQKAYQLLGYESVACLALRNLEPGRPKHQQVCGACLGSARWLVDVHVRGCFSQEAMGLLKRASHPPVRRGMEADDQGADGDSCQVQGRQRTVEVQRHEGFTKFRASRYVSFPFGWLFSCVLSAQDLPGQVWGCHRPDS